MKTWPLIALALTLTACQRRDAREMDFLTDDDGDGVTADQDCDDGDGNDYPGNVEVCDGQDNNCDGVIDVDASDAVALYTDADADGWGAGEAIQGCPEALPELVAKAGDCDDSDATRNPDALDDCDNVDTNCDGNVDDEGALTTWYLDTDADAYGDALNTVDACFAPTGYVDVAGDCDSVDANIHPGALEVCDGVDNDCNGAVDENEASFPKWYLDADGDGWTGADTTQQCDAPSGAKLVSDADCDDASAAIHPGMVDPPGDGVDADCDGLDGTDADGDGGFDIASGGDDCNDADASVYVSAPETPYNGVDEDCSGADLVDVDGDSFAGGPGGADCDDENPAVSPDSTEVLGNSVDDDCDGIVDVVAPALVSVTFADHDAENKTYVTFKATDLDDGLELGTFEIDLGGVVVHGDLASRLDSWTWNATSHTGTGVLSLPYDPCVDLGAPKDVRLLVADTASLSDEVLDSWTTPGRSVVAAERGELTDSDLLHVGTLTTRFVMCGNTVETAYCTTGGCSTAPLMDRDGFRFTSGLNAAWYVQLVATSPSNPLSLGDVGLVVDRYPSMPGSVLFNQQGHAGTDSGVVALTQGGEYRALVLSGKVTYARYPGVYSTDWVLDLRP